MCINIIKKSYFPLFRPKEKTADAEEITKKTWLDKKK